ncbi:MAG: hypothetical protein IJ318_02050 [Clostridia bacterium]|nr:hypothetical protein [Clostridia bacterium]
MFVINNKDVLPEILLSAHKFYEELLNALANTTQEQINSQEFATKYSAYMANGWQLYKATLSDLCIGIKALGDKLGTLGGDSFVNLKKSSEKLIEATGKFFNSVVGYDFNSGNAYSLLQIAKTYFEAVTALLKELSTSTKHMYGDAKNRLGAQFAGMENAMVGFIHMAKIKVVASLVNSQIALQYACQTFASAISASIAMPVQNASVLNEDGSLNKLACQNLVATLIVDFDEAKAQALKMFN